MKVDKAFFDFGDAIKYCINGFKISRLAWKNKDIYITLQKESATIVDEEEIISKIHPYFQIRNSDKTISAWLPNAEDILANDWFALVLD